MNKIISIISIIILVSCNFSNDPRNNSWKYKAAIESSKNIKNIVYAYSETTPVVAQIDEDSADDPAIWINQNNREKSTIIGTNKVKGLSVYSLEGKLKYTYPIGKVNNVDIRYNCKFFNSKMDIVACSNRSYNSIDFFKVDTLNGALIKLKVDNNIVPRDIVNEVYGFCLHKDIITKKLYAFVNSKAGTVVQYHVKEENNNLHLENVRVIKMSDQTEGMVADDENSILYVGEEQKGIWKFSTNPKNKMQIFLKQSAPNQNNIVDDIEGLSIYYTQNGDGYLIASSQGNFSYAVFERKGDNKYVGSFKINAKEIDAVEETDGIDVVNIPMGDKYPNGFLVVQDGFNYDKDSLKSQNFKIIKWEHVATSFTRNLKIDNTYKDWINL